MPHEFKTHLIIPRIDPGPGRPGLTELFRAIKKVRPRERGVRHILDGDLCEMHPQALRALRMLQLTGCVDWRISYAEKDLPE